MSTPGASTSQHRDATEALPFAGGLCAPGGDRRRAQLRALLLACVWALPALWCAGHGLVHALESAHHAVHVGAAADEWLCTDVIDHHHHGHSHPESPPLLSAKPTKQVDSPWTLTATLEVAPSQATLQWRTDIASDRTRRLALAVPGPRAPPTSPVV